MKRSNLNAAGVAPIIIALGVIFHAVNGRAATVNVSVGPHGSMSFAPDPVSINVGDTVLWTWGSSPHSVTSGTADHPTTDFDSGVQFAPFSFSHTFTTAGSFPY